MTRDDGETAGHRSRAGTGARAGAGAGTADASGRTGSRGASAETGAGGASCEFGTSGELGPSDETGAGGEFGADGSHGGTDTSGGTDEFDEFDGTNAFGTGAASGASGETSTSGEFGASGGIGSSGGTGEFGAGSADGAPGGTDTSGGTDGTDEFDGTNAFGTGAASGASGEFGAGGSHGGTDTSGKFDGTDPSDGTNVSGGFGAGGAGGAPGGTGASGGTGGDGASGGTGASAGPRPFSEGRFLAPSAVCVLIAAPALLLDRVPPAVTLAQLLIGCALTAHAVRQRDRLLAQLTEVREVARITQEAVVRPISRSFGGTHISTRYHCAVPGSALGGDLYDVAVTPFGLRVLIGDVRGHGLEAVRLTAEAVAGFRELAHTVPDLPAVATGLDERLAPGLGPEDFVTALLAEFAPGEVRLVNCGHPAPLRCGHRAELLEPGVTTLPLGLCPDPRQYRVRLQPGDRLLLYTDGLTEARAPDGTFFPFLTEAADALREPLPDEALDLLHARLLAHTGAAPTDDLALVLCQPTQPAQPTATTPHPIRRSV